MEATNQTPQQIQLRIDKNASDLYYELHQRRPDWERVAIINAEQEVLRSRLRNLKRGEIK